MPLLAQILSENWLLQVLNVFFFAFHLLLILFSLTAWAFRKWRKWHLISVGITAFSWLALGWFYGWGYCFLTDWHFSIRRELGLTIDSSSYIQFLINRLGIDLWSAQITDVITAVAFGAVAIASIYLNLRDYRKSNAR